MSAFLAFSVKNIFTFYELNILLQNLPNFTYKEMLLKHGGIIITSWKLSVFWVILVRIFLHSDRILRISPYSVRMRENRDQNNSEYGRFLRSEY